MLLLRQALAGGIVEPGEHWCVTATRVLAEAGARLRSDSPGPEVHPFRVLGTEVAAWWAAAAWLDAPG